jgi:hypothetical protein
MTELFIPAIKILYLTGIEDQDQIHSRYHIFPNLENVMPIFIQLVSKKKTLDLEKIDMLAG